jgi:hypothetical protein
MQPSQPNSLHFSSARTSEKMCDPLLDLQRRQRPGSVRLGWTRATQRSAKWTLRRRQGDPPAGICLHECKGTKISWLSEEGFQSHCNAASSCWVLRHRVCRFRNSFGLARDPTWDTMGSNMPWESEASLFFFVLDPDFWFRWPDAGRIS